MEKKITLEEFRNTVSETLLYNRSILDVLAKIHENSATLQRSVIKSVTRCGCIEINASKANIESESSLTDLQQLMDSHVKGNLCEGCKESIARSVGSLLFYTTAVCNLLDLDVNDIVLNEQKQKKLLGLYNLA